MLESLSQAQLAGRQGSAGTVGKAGTSPRTQHGQRAADPRALTPPHPAEGNLLTPHRLTTSECRMQNIPQPCVISTIIHLVGKGCSWGMSGLGLLSSLSSLPLLSLGTALAGVLPSVSLAGSSLSPLQTRVCPGLSPQTLLHVCFLHDLTCAMTLGTNY